MEAREHLQAGRLPEALASLQEAIRKVPADPGLRIFLFELCSVLGEWEKATRQLEILAELDADGLVLSRMFQPIIQSELVRAKVFAGTDTPLIFGEPEPWMSSLVQANYLLATGQAAAARPLRDEAFAAAPASAGAIGDQPFAWLADADSRLGPMLEVFLERKYFWVPFSRIASIEMEPPESLRDILWVNAQFTWINGGAASGHIPTRYSGTESSQDHALRLSRKTEWLDRGEDLFAGLGQRMLSSDQSDHPLLEIRRIAFEHEPTPAPAANP